MRDIWGFLLQTLTVSGSAALLLLIKAMFRDKLPPKWHFAVWGILGAVMLIPAGAFGTYTLFNWRTAVEVIKGWFHDYGFIRVILPFPIPSFDVPKTPAEWLFAVYATGVILSLLRYTVSYVRLRLALRGSEGTRELEKRVCDVAERYGLKACRAVYADGVPSAFLCGIFRPVLVLPSDTETDDKVILHELLHYRNRDTAVSAVCAVFRSVHWCNPFISYCLGRAVNDMEARCDQMVLELIEGEERRDYGRILLSMSNDKYARTPGSTSMNNGGKNIRERIEAIVRFKKYPVGMKLVSVCTLIPLLFSLSVGTRANVASDSASLAVDLASARSTACTTCAGAFDAYGKAVLSQNGIYRAMCAPESEQGTLAETLRENGNRFWDSGLGTLPYNTEGYYIYNIKSVGKDAYEALFVISVNSTPENEYPNMNEICVAYQPVSVYKENGRWVLTPLGGFEFIMTNDKNIGWGCIDLPGDIYVGEAANMRAEVKSQTVCVVNNKIQNSDLGFIFPNTAFYDMKPKPHAEFEYMTCANRTSLVHLGTQSERDTIWQTGLSSMAVYGDEERPALAPAASGSLTSSSTDGSFIMSAERKPGWGPIALVGGGGGHTYWGDTEIHAGPEYYAADLYINGKLVGSIDMVKGEAHE